MENMGEELTAAEFFSFWNLAKKVACLDGKEWRQGRFSPFGDFLRFNSNILLDSTYTLFHPKSFMVNLTSRDKQTCKLLAGRAQWLLQAIESILDESDVHVDGFGTQSDRVGEVKIFATVQGLKDLSLRLRTVAAEAFVRMIRTEVSQLETNLKIRPSASIHPMIEEWKTLTDCVPRDPSTVAMKFKDNDKAGLVLLPVADSTTPFLMKVKVRFRPQLPANLINKEIVKDLVNGRALKSSRPIHIELLGVRQTLTTTLVLDWTLEDASEWTRTTFYLLDVHRGFQGFGLAIRQCTEDEPVADVGQCSQELQTLKMSGTSQHASPLGCHKRDDGKDDLTTSDTTDRVVHSAESEPQHSQPVLSPYEGYEALNEYQLHNATPYSVTFEEYSSNFYSQAGPSEAIQHAPSGITHEARFNAPSMTIYEASYDTPSARRSDYQTTTGKHTMSMAHDYRPHQPSQMSTMDSSQTKEIRRTSESW